MSDLIRREDAIEALHKKCVTEGLLDEFDTEDTLRKLPSAEPERKKGEWETVPWKIIEHGEVVVVGDAQRCSVCRHAEKGWKKEMKYCPNCGSEMSRGDQ